MTHPLFQHPEAAHVGEILITTEQLQTRVREIGEAISSTYADQGLVLVGVLKGVLCFMADLLRAIRVPVEVDFLSISGYGAGQRGHGEVRLLKDLECAIEGRHVLFVEDIVDTGLSLAYLLRHIRARRPASLEVCALLDRPQRRIVPMDMCFVGFQIPDVWVVGYGMDYREQFRNLPYIAVFHPPGQPENGQPIGAVVAPDICEKNEPPAQ